MAVATFATIAQDTKTSRPIHCHAWVKPQGPTGPAKATMRDAIPVATAIARARSQNAMVMSAIAASPEPRGTSRMVHSSRSREPAASASRIAPHPSTTGSVRRYQQTCRLIDATQFALTVPSAATSNSRTPFADVANDPPGATVIRQFAPLAAAVTAYGLFAGSWVITWVVAAAGTV